MATSASATCYYSSTIQKEKKEKEGQENERNQFLGSMENENPTQKLGIGIDVCVREKGKWSERKTIDKKKNNSDFNSEREKGNIFLSSFFIFLKKK